MRWFLVTATSWRELFGGGGEDDGGFEVDRIFFDGVEIEGDEGTLFEGGGGAFGLPVFVELYDDLAVEHAVNAATCRGWRFFSGRSGV